MVTGTIELLNRVMAAVTAAKQDKDSKNVAETDHSKLWEVQHYNETSYWFLKTGQFTNKILLILLSNC